METHLWSGAFGALVVLTLAAWVASGLRARFRGWGWWRPPAFIAGSVIALSATLSQLDALGEEGLLTAHVTQHLMLADLAAPLLLLGLPLKAREAMGKVLARLAARPELAPRIITLLLSPVGAFVAWAVVTYVWFVPPLHRLAIPDGPVHFLDHVSFLVFGLAIWLGAFDPRRTRDVRAGLRLGGLPWWGRHIYAMVTRLAMLPVAFAVWLAGPATYYAVESPLPFGLSRPGDQERAASVMIGFEMLLFGLAVVLAFIFVSVHEGRERARRAA